jgi:CBS domain containing-hemolysin-like protein
VRVPGHLRLDEAADRYGLPTVGRVDSLAAALTDGLGRLPAAGDEIAVGDWTVRAATVRKHRVLDVDLVAPAAAGPPADAAREDEGR